MGGFGSGRKNGRPIRDGSKVIDIALMFRQGWVKDGYQASSQLLNWYCNGGPSGSIRFDYDMLDPDHASMTLRFSARNRESGEQSHHVQHVRLSYTLPRLGGRRWWMHCPVTGERVAKLYSPAGGVIFAGRKAWRLGYRSQRISKWEQPFEALFRLQERLGGHRGMGQILNRPKGMRRSTFDRHMERHQVLEDRCNCVMTQFATRLEISDEADRL